VARAINPIDRSASEGIEGEMRGFGQRTESRLRAVNRPPFRPKGVYEPGFGTQDVINGAIAGAVAGLAAGWAMVKFQEAWAKVAEGRQESKNLRDNVPEHRTKPDANRADGEMEQSSDQQSRGDRQIQTEETDDATIRTAEMISEKVFDHKLSREEKKVAGPAVHYCFSIVMGALYGVAAEVTPKATAGFGTAFGAALFVAADEIGVPAMGLSPNVQEVPLSKHAYGLVSHLVFGAATEAARRPIRQMLL
jgi:hypothetical protein